MDHFAIPAVLALWAVQRVWAAVVDRPVEEVLHRLVQRKVKRLRLRWAH